MGQIEGQIALMQQRPPGPPHLRTIYAFFGVSMFMTAALVWKARSSFSHPFPNWMSESERWYDHLLGALVWASFATASFMYLRYRTAMKRDGRKAAVRLWPCRRETRFALYIWAATLCLQFPIAIYRSILAVSDRSGPAPTNNFFSVFPLGGVLFPLVGGVIIVYDRRRTTREQRIMENRCSVCGYDLRASPERCPECGSPTGRSDAMAA
jgi:hypothetical protein